MEMLKNFYNTQALMSDFCWRDSCAGGRMEEDSSISELEEIQKAVKTMKGNYLHLLFDRDHLLKIIEIYHCAIQEGKYEIGIPSHELDITHDSLKSTQR